MNLKKTSLNALISCSLLLSGCAGAHLKGDVLGYYNHQNHYDSKTILIVNVTQTVLSRKERSKVYRQEMLATTAPGANPAPSEKDKETELLSQNLQKNQAALGDELVELLTQKGIRSISSADLNRLSPASKAAPKLRLNVNISLLKDGNRPLRILIGWGLGKSKLQTEVNLEDLRVTPAHECLSFNLHADSGWEPGAFGLLLPVGWIPSLFIVGAKTGLDIYKLPDAKRSAEAIVPEVERYYVKQHWLPAPEPTAKTKK